MIGNTSIEVSASRPWMPLGPFAVFAGSAMTLRVSGVPRSGDGFELSGVLVSVTNADGATVSVSAADTNGDGVWTATVPASHFATTGTVSGGVQVIATGSDETGAARSWIVGRGDLQILDADGVPTPGETLQNVHLRDSVPASPLKGDLCIGPNGWQIYVGSAWSVIPRDVVDPADATTAGQAADALKVKQALARKAGTADLAGKADGSQVCALKVSWNSGQHAYSWKIVGLRNGYVGDAWFLVIDDADHYEVIPFAKGSTTDRSGWYYGYRFVVAADGSITAYYYEDSSDPLDHTDELDYDRAISGDRCGVVVADHVAPTSVDAVPTASSTKLVRSGGVKAALDGKASLADATLTPTVYSDWNVDALPSGVRDKTLAVVRDSAGERKYRWQLGVTQAYAQSSEEWDTDTEARAATTLTMSGSSVPTPAVVTRYVAAYRYDAGPNSGREVVAAYNGCIHSKMLNSDSVTNAKIAGGAVSNSKLADNAVTNSKIKDGAITKAKLGADIQLEIDTLATRVAYLMSLPGNAPADSEAFALAVGVDPVDATTLADVVDALNDQGAALTDTSTVQDAVDSL